MADQWVQGLQVNADRILSIHSSCHIISCIIYYLTPSYPPALSFSFCPPTLPSSLPPFLTNFFRVPSSSSTLFRGNDEGFTLAPAFVALQGYYAALKCCMAGLVLVCDMNVSAFLLGGEMIELMRLTGGFHSIDDMVNACSQPGGMNKTVIARMNEKLKGAKVKTKHLGYWKKVKGFGEPARDYKFQDESGETISIQVTHIHTHTDMHTHTHSHTHTHRNTHYL